MGGQTMKKLISGAVLVATMTIAAAGLNAQDFEWNGQLQSGDVLEIEGVLGDIRAVVARGNEVEVTAEVREHRRGYAEDISFEVVEHSGGVTICALYPTSRRARHDNECRPDGRTRNNTNNIDVEVNFTVHVPAGVDFIGHTVNGDIDVNSLSSNVDVRTVNGSIDVSTSGYAEANTVNGDIDAVLGDPNWDGMLEFETVNGSITVELPDGIGADVSAGTVNGAIDTDFPLTVQGRFSHRRLSGSIGGGGERISLNTVNGSISLLRGR
jgi:hypothetical protein